MTRAPFDQWQAQVAPEAFADRAAAAVLRDRVLSRRQGERRWVLLAAAACVLVAGAAWGWTSSRRVPLHDVAPSRLEPLKRMDPTPSAPPRGPQGTLEVLPLPPRPVPVRAKPVTPALPPSAAPSPSALRVPLPQCNCNAFACDCGPE